MARAEKTKGGPFTYSRGFSLTPEQKNTLLELIGVDTHDNEDRDYNKESLFLINIEQYLGAYEGIVDITDNAPRPANYRVEIESLRIKSRNLLHDYIHTSYWMNEFINENGCDFNELKHSLAKFIDTTGVMLSELESKESRGRPQNNGIKILCNTLYEVFKNFYTTPPLEEDMLEEKDKTDGRKLSGYDETAIKFLKTCLEFKKIPIPNDIRGILYNENTSSDERVYIQKS